MYYRQLGNSEIQISEVGFGCMSLEDHDASNNSLIHRAIELGINFFDTADLYQYGINEAMLGIALKGKREQILLATKVGNIWRPDNKGWDWKPGKAYIISAVEKSLQRLQTDRIDLYQLHGGTLEDPIDEIIETFELLKQQGKIRYYGISSIRPAVIREYVNRAAITSVMMQYSLLDRRPEEGTLALLMQKNIGVLARGSLAKGLLAGKPPSDYLNYKKEDVEVESGIVNSISGKNRSAAQTALRYVLQNPAISSAVVGIRTSAQLEEAAAAVKTPVLSTKEIKILADSIRVNYYSEHR
jgi:aryl-alcohol dehydrogenase-like predicted oxidoreductase